MLYGSIIDGQETKKQRRARLKYQKQLILEQAKREKNEKAQLLAIEKQKWQSQNLPSRGENRPYAGKTLWDTKVSTIRATNLVLRTAYPFISERGIGQNGMLMGIDIITIGAFCFDPWEIYRQKILSNPNIVLAGVIGTGKSATCKAIAIRGVAFGRKVYVPGDVKGEWSVVAKKLGGAVIKISPGLSARLNPLDEGVRPEFDSDGEYVDDNKWSHMVSVKRQQLLSSLIASTLERNLRPEEYTALYHAIDCAVSAHSIPIITHVARNLLEPQDYNLPLGVKNVEVLRDLGFEVGHAIQRIVCGDIAGIFDGESTVKFDTKTPMLTVDLSQFSQTDATLPLLLTCTASWMESSLRDPNAGKRYVIYDEAHRLMMHHQLLERMKEQWKIARGWGLSNVLVLHRFSDLEALGDTGSKAKALAEGILADASTRIVFRQEADQMRNTKRIMGLNQTSIETISNIRLGQALWQIPKRSYLVQHIFTPDEIALFDTDKAMRETKNV